jgi:hypothetical protein
VFHPLNQQAAPRRPRPPPGTLARRTPMFGAVLLWGAGLGVMACTLSEDFEPRAITPSQASGGATAANGASGSGNMPTGCNDPRGCCVVDTDCFGEEVCVDGICQQPTACTSLDEVSVCQLELCPGPSCPTNATAGCSDDVQNGDETGVDCGGSCPRTCMLVAAAPTCSDQVHNQDETAVDCGGSCPTKCAQGQRCDVDSDCSDPLLCSPSGRVCTAVSCADNQQNGNEILVDCGGGTCPGCPSGTACGAAADCASNICALGVCRAAPLCEDDEQNAAETDVDCGGPDPGCERCADGASCAADSDCARNDCAQGVCISCQDTVRNGGETDVDCGGANLTCRRCGLNQDCALDRDCQSGNCNAGVCVSFSCDDDEQNGNETGVDCGGNGVGCGPCPDGSGCRGAGDCASGLCSANVCVSCDDDTRNGTETDVDCGGANACARCAPGLACSADGDCVSGACVDGRCCGGSQGDCTRCAERLSPTINCDAPQAGQDSTGVANCRAFLECLASNPTICPTRNAAGCSGDNQAADACPHNDYGGNAGTGLTRANQVLQNAGCQL